MGRLLLLNGLPGSGKSTLASRYVLDRRLSLCLDIDVVRELLGAWQDAPSEAGHLARRLGLAMAREVLRDGHDVVVPQLLARGEFIDELGSLALRCNAEFCEVWLHQDPDQALEQLQARAAGPMTAAQRSAHAALDRQGNLAQSISSLQRRLAELERRRPAARPLRPNVGDVEATYRALLAMLEAPPGD